MNRQAENANPAPGEGARFKDATGAENAATMVAPATRAVNPDAAFLTAVFGDLPEQCPCFHLWTCSADKATKRTHWCRTVADAVTAAQRAAGRHVYYGIGLSTKPGEPTERVKASTVAGIVGLVADIDIGTHDNGKHYCPDQEAALALIGGIGLLPTAVIHSGGGLQALWLFKEPWAFDTDAERAEAAALSEGWGKHIAEVAERHGYQVDAVHDLTRLMRLPGTWNVKPEYQEPRPVAILRADYSRRYNPSAFAVFLPATPEPEPTPARTPTATPGPAAADGDLLQVAFEARNGADIRTLFAEPGADGNSEGDARLCGLLAFYSGGDPATLERLMRLSARVRPKWDEARGAETWIGRECRVAVERCSDFYGRKRDRDPDQGTEPLLSFRATDAGNGEALAHLYGADLRFDWLRERWLRWTGTLWEPATMGHLACLAKETARQRYTAAGRADNTALRKWAFASEARGRVEASLFFARGEYPISDDGDGWDADPDLLGTPNCIVDLTTGTARPGTRADRVTMKTSVAFNPSAEAPRWTRFLDEVFGGDGEMIDFVQRAVGYSLTGHISEQVFFLLNGRGSNGKSLLIEVLDAVLGDYGHTAPFKVFDYAQRTDHAQELAQFEGRRFVIAAESVENARLNEERLKALSGSGTIRANLMRQNSREFPNTVKLWLATNHRPRVLDDTDAFWRRARLIPFGTRFVDDDVLEADPELRDDQTVLPCDKHLKAKLMDEAAGILRWCVAGAARWHEDGLRVPDRVKQASTAWRDEADELGEFMGACCELGAARRVFADDIYRVYFRWAAIQGLREREVLSRTAFGRRLGHRFDRRRVLIDDRRGMVYFGVGLSDYGDELLELQH